MGLLAVLKSVSSTKAPLQGTQNVLKAWWSLACPLRSLVQVRVNQKVHLGGQYL